MKIQHFFKFILFISILFFIFGCSTSSNHSSSFDELDTTYLENPEFYEEVYGVPDKVIQEVWKRDQGKCVSCKSSQNIGYAHKTSPKEGGKNTEENIQLECKPCYSKR